MSLTYPAFRASHQIMAAAKNAPPLRSGSRGDGVKLIQASLIDLGYPMPVSTRRQQGPDGIYGGETTGKVAHFQRDRGLKDDGITGRNTIAALDRSTTELNHVTPKVVRRPVAPRAHSSDYRIGIGVPPYRLDPPSPHGDRPATLMNSVVAMHVRAAAHTVGFAWGPDAAKALQHYLSNRGTDYEVRFRQLVSEEKKALEAYQSEIRQAKAFAEQLSLGRHFICSKNAEIATAYDSKNWAYSAGGYLAWGSGVLEISEDASSRIYELDFSYRMADRYNFDPGKGVALLKLPIKLERYSPFGVDIDLRRIETPIDGVRIEGDELVVDDTFLHALHRQGLAKEFNTHGGFNRHLRWRHGYPVPWDQVNPANA